MLRFLKILVELIAGFVGVAVVLGLLLAWRLSVHPIRSDFLTPYIETGIESILPGSEVHVAGTLLTWSAAERAIAMHADNIRVSDGGGVIALIPSLDAKISALGLMFGQFMPKDLAIDHPQIKLERNQEGAFVFGGMKVGAGSGASSPGAIGNVLRKLSARMSRAALMHKLAVTRAVFDVHDEATEKNWSVSIPEISVTRRELSEVGHRLEYGALDGHMTVEVTQKDAVASLDVRYAYDPAAQEHSLSSVFNDLTPAFVAGGHPETLGLGAAAVADLPVTGEVQVTLDRDLAVKTVAAEIHGDEGHLVYADFWDKPCSVKSIDVKAEYDRSTKTLTVSDTHIDFGGPTLDLGVDGKASAQPEQDMDFTASIKANNLPMNRYSEIWPKAILTNPREWLVANVRDGMFPHAEVILKGSLAFNDMANLSITDGSGKASAQGARVNYLEGMPPAEGINADAVFDLKKMDVQITSGGVGNIHLSPFSAHITGLADPDQYIDIPLQFSAPLSEVLALIDHPPLGYARALGLSPDAIGGTIAGTVDFHFPLLKDLTTKNLDIHATVNTTALASTKLIPGLAINQGDFAIAMDVAGFTLKGQAAVGRIPFHVVWQENFAPKEGQILRHATVTGTVRDDQWNDLGVSAFNGTKGAINLAVDMSKPNKEKTVFTGTLDMTPASVELDMLNWKKNANVPALMKFTAQAVAGKPVEVSSISLRGTQIEAEGDASLSPDMSQLLSLNLSPFKLGRTDAALHFTQTFGEDGALRIEATGASLDVGGLRGGNDPERADPRPKEYHVQVGTLYTGATGEIIDANGAASRDSEGWRAINLHGLADGDTPLSLELTPQADGHRDFRIVCDNFGKAMKGLGFTDTITGGKLSVTGQSTAEDPRVIIGSVKINDFAVQKLPVLALLLNAASPFGFTGLLTDSADFSKFQGDFRWQGDRITLIKAHAAGSAVGINMDGKVDMNSGDANLEGTLVPFSVMNDILNYIPIFGDILTGGKDQGVLAVAYEIKGHLSAPQISVNPTSLLTPGFVRNLFFGDDVDTLGTQ